MHNDGEGMLTGVWADLAIRKQRDHISAANRKGGEEGGEMNLKAYPK